MSYTPRALRRRSKPRFGWVVVIIIMSFFALWLVLPSFMWMEKAPPERPYLVYRGQRHVYPVVVEDNEVYVPFGFVKSVLDPNAFCDEAGTVVVTTDNKVIKLKTDSLTAYVNQHPVELSLPVVLDKGEPYIPASTLETLYPVSTGLYRDSGIFLVRDLNEETTWAKIGKDSIVRMEPSFISRRVGLVPCGTEVRVFETKGGWSRVETADGCAGYLPEKAFTGIETRQPQVPPASEYVPAPLKGSKVSLVWEQVDSRTPDPSSFGPMPGLNVVSPTWFHLAETPGIVENRADLRYVQWAHRQGYQVWALFSNSFDLERTRTVLRDSDLRDKVISQILIYSKIYSLDGINIDFENVYEEDAPYLTQFVRELTPLLHQANLTVSIDVTVKSQSPTWSLCYERGRLAETVDYVMLMAYDQYGVGSKVAGPTSAVPWAEWTVQKTLEEVPKEKLVLGIPFYTRLWKETEVDGALKVTQRAYSMKGAEEWVASQRLTPTLDQENGLKYVEKKIGQDTYKMWLEDSDSIRARVDVATKYQLAGVAAWKRGHEKPEIWEVIEEYLTR